MSTLKKAVIGLLIAVILLLAAGWWLLRGDAAQLPLQDVTGTDPVLAEPDEQTIPTVAVAKPSSSST